MNVNSWWWLVLFCVLSLLCGCAPYRMSTEDYIVQRGSVSVSEEELCAGRHWLYWMIPRHRCQIRWYDAGHWCSWMLLGNDDDGIFGESSLKKHRWSTEYNVQRAFFWTLRNPLHNFCYYVIGEAHRNHGQLTLLSLNTKKCGVFKYRSKADMGDLENNTGMLMAFHGWKPFFALRMYLSPRYRCDFYVGWRERGNFGFKCQPLKKIHS